MVLKIVRVVILVVITSLSIVSVEAENRKLVQGGVYMDNNNEFWTAERDGISLKMELVILSYVPLCMFTGFEVGTK